MKISWKESKILRALGKILLFIIVTIAVTFFLALKKTLRSEAKHNISEILAKKSDSEKEKFELKPVTEEEFKLESGEINLTDKQIDQLLIQTASELNKSVPITVNRETQLTSYIALPGKKLVYNYTLLNMSIDDIDTGAFRDIILENKPITVNSIRTANEMTDLRNSGVTFVYRYSDNLGNFISELVVSPEDYSKSFNKAFFDFYNALRKNKYIKGLPDSYSQFEEIMRDRDVLESFYYTLKASPNIKDIPVTYDDFLTKMNLN